MALFSRFSQFWTIFGGHTLIENQNLTLFPSDVGPKLSNPVRYIQLTGYDGGIQPQRHFPDCWLVWRIFWKSSNHFGQKCPFFW